MFKAKQAFAVIFPSSSKSVYRQRKHMYNIYPSENFSSASWLNNLFKYKYRYRYEYIYKMREIPKV